MGIPDEQIHPSATGAAANTVEQHQDPQDLVFYAGWVRIKWNVQCVTSQLTTYHQSKFCPYVQRSWIVLEEKGIPYQYKEVNPYKKEKHFLGEPPPALASYLKKRPSSLANT